jgi:hypothetical protein
MTIHTDATQTKSVGSMRFPSPFEYPLPEILMIFLLARRRGAMVHSCGIDDAGKGYLFCGNSTHGKTTMSGLWAQAGATVLNDDRIVLRRAQREFVVSGTPFHGDSSLLSNRTVLLDRIFFLKHGPQPCAIPKGPSEALAMIMSRSFSPWWDRDGLDFTLTLFSDVVHQVPCFELEFPPDLSTVEFVRCMN